VPGLSRDLIEGRHVSYQHLISLKSRDYSNFEVLIVGAGWMAGQYAEALKKLGVRRFGMVCRSEATAGRCRERYGIEAVPGGFERGLRQLGGFDLTIVALPIHELVTAAEAAIECGHRNILVEKPGALTRGPLAELQGRADAARARVRVAYNRLAYPNLWQLKSLVAAEGGATSCRYTFTELVRAMDFDKERPEVYQRWGIANSLHVIAMAHDLIGPPENLTALQQGSLPWHRSGDRFVGAGKTRAGVPFSYHADWSSGGRWGIEVMTAENAYRLMPLEDLYRCPRGSFDWAPVGFETPFPGVKPGVAEQTAVMLAPDVEAHVPLVALQRAMDFITLAEKILGYED